MCECLCLLGGRVVGSGSIGSGGSGGSSNSIDSSAVVAGGD